VSPEEAKENVRKTISPDGGLFSLGWYLGWVPGDEKATLDGEFTAAELRAIADHMEGK
jgi:hypothetical protein